MSVEHLRGRSEKSPGQEESEFFQVAENRRKDAQQGGLGELSPRKDT